MTICIIKFLKKLADALVKYLSNKLQAQLNAEVVSVSRKADQTTKAITALRKDEVTHSIESANKQYDIADKIATVNSL